MGGVEASWRGFRVSRWGGGVCICLRGFEGLLEGLRRVGGIWGLLRGFSLGGFWDHQGSSHLCSEAAPVAGWQSTVTSEQPTLSSAGDFLFGGAWQSCSGQ